MSAIDTNTERPQTCNSCGAPSVWCHCDNPSFGPVPAPFVDRDPDPEDDVSACFACGGAGVYEDHDGELVPCSSCDGSGLD